MVRGRIEMKKIENSTRRQVTFSKRRSGLLKKAYELSVLCDAEVALIIFSQKGRLHEFATSDMRKTIERYCRYVKETRTSNADIEQHKEVGLQHQLMHEIAILVNQIKLLEASRRKFLGQSLETCSMEELQQMDMQMEHSLRSIRERKDQLFKQQIEGLKGKEKLLLQENRSLFEKFCRGSYKQQQQQPTLTLTKQCTDASTSSRSLTTQGSEVETELLIGLPEMRHLHS